MHPTLSVDQSLADQPTVGQPAVDQATSADREPSVDLSFIDFFAQLAAEMRDHLKLENDELREKLALNAAVRSALESEVELKRLREENERLKAQEAERKKRFAALHALAA